MPELIWVERFLGCNSLPEVEKLNPHLRIAGGGFLCLGNPIPPSLHPETTKTPKQPTTKTAKYPPKSEYSGQINQ